MGPRRFDPPDSSTRTPLTRAQRPSSRSAARPSFKYDRSGACGRRLATSFTTPNTLTYVYTIRPNVKFWDGTTLTPADVVFSLQQAASSKAGSQIAAFYTAGQSITAKGTGSRSSSSSPIRTSGTRRRSPTSSRRSTGRRTSRTSARPRS